MYVCVRRAGLPLSALMWTVFLKKTLDISPYAFIFTSLQLSPLDMSVKNSVCFEPNVSVFVDRMNSNTLITLGGLNLYYEKKPYSLVCTS